jgi:cytochrome c551/c552
MKCLITAILFGLMLTSCGNGKSSVEQIKSQTIKTVEPPATLAEAEKNWKDYNGIGPVTSVDLSGEINQEMAAEGQAIYELKCTACHKVDKRFIGPSPQGIFERRTGPWIMNMILNPEQMVQEDPLAKLLLIEFNGSPMANQNLTEEEARAVLEYFRTL